MAGTTGTEDEVADRVRQAVLELYAGEPGGFVERRTALVKEARAAKDRDAAKEIGALRKPSLSAWAVNQVVRADRALVARLRDLGARMRHAQSTLDGKALAGLRTERDAVLKDLAKAAGRAASGHGQALSEAVQGEIRDTAVAAFADAAAEEVAWSGSLTRALQYSGFGEVDISDAVARTSTGVLLARIEGGAGKEEPEGEPEEEPEVEVVDDDAPEEELEDDDADADSDEEMEDEEETDVEDEEDEFEGEDGEEEGVAAEAEDGGVAADPAELEDARLSLEVAEHEVAARTAQLRLLTTRATATGRRLEQVEAEVADLEQEVADLTARLEAARDRLAKRRKDLARNRTEHEDASKRIGAMEEAVAAAMAERDAARQRVAELERD
jgi:chromosome segregation ATPase